MGSVVLKKIKLPNGEELGYREGGNGKPILLAHGNLVSSRHWLNLLERLADKYTVYGIDLRGAGISTYNNPVNSFDDWANDIKLFCDELGLKNFALIGWSMGGGISQRFVASYPEYADRLILFESIPCTGNSYHKKGPNGEFLPECYTSREELLEDKIQLKPMIAALENNNRPFMKYLWDQLVFNVNKPDEVEYEALMDDIYMTRNLRDAAWSAHTFNISHISNGVAEGTGEIDNIEIPVLILSGGRDIIVPSSLAEFTAREIGDNAELIILDDCGHAPHYDNLDLITRKIENFCRF